MKFFLLLFNFLIPYARTQRDGTAKKTYPISDDDDFD